MVDQPCINELVSVYIPTHLIDLGKLNITKKSNINNINYWEPPNVNKIQYYTDHEMMMKTILSCNNQLGLCNYYVYIDNSSIGNEHFDIYFQQLIKMSLKLRELNINVIIEQNSKCSFRENYFEFVNNCTTPFFLFLEHDWEFVSKLNTRDIITIMQMHDIGYMSITNYYKSMKNINAIIKAMTNANYSAEQYQYNDVKYSHKMLYDNTPHFENINYSKTIYIPRIQATKEIYHTGTEGELREKIKYFFKVSENQNDKTVQEHFDNWKLYTIITNHDIIRHLGDWCRKC
jgi:hypothetical protein